VGNVRIWFGVRGPRSERPTGYSSSFVGVGGLSLLPLRSSPFAPPIEFGVCGAALLRERMMILELLCI
jgi:hypothetical protein